MDPSNEHDLIRCAVTDPDALRDLYRHYLPRVFAYVSYRIEREGDAEDITSEVFMTMVKHLPLFENRGEGAFAAWLFRIAKNVVNMHYRRQQRRPFPLSLDDQPDIAGSVASPEEIVERQERLTRLRQAIATLSPRRQEVLRLRYFAGLNNQEIAAVLGLDERSVASHLSRALDDLQYKYRDELTQGESL